MHQKKSVTIKEFLGVTSLISLIFALLLFFVQLVFYGYLGAWRSYLWTSIAGLLSLAIVAGSAWCMHVLMLALTHLPKNQRRMRGIIYVVLWCTIIGCALVLKYQSRIANQPQSQLYWYVLLCAGIFLFWHDHTRRRG